MIRALQAIVFDFDGVISDSEALHLRAYQDVLAPLGLSLSTEEYYQEYVGYHDMGVVERYAENRQLRWGVADMSQLVDEKSRRYEELSVRGEMIFQARPRSFGMRRQSFQSALRQERARKRLKTSWVGRT